MSIIQDLEALKYRSVIDLIRKEEPYDKNKNIISGDEAFTLCFNRYLILQEILLPLKEKLGKEVEVTDISFVNGMQNDIRIIIKYNRGNKQYTIALTNIENQDIEIIADDEIARKQGLIRSNKRIVLNAFYGIDENNLTDDITIKSTSGRFILHDNYDSFEIKDVDGKLFRLEKKYSSYVKDKSLTNPTKLECNFPKLRELLENEDNVLALYNHFHAYENMFPTSLIKKLTYR